MSSAENSPRTLGAPAAASTIVHNAAVIVAAHAAHVQAAAPAAPPATVACPPLLDHTVPRLQDEKPQQLCRYAGKVLLVVNTASY